MSCLLFVVNPAPARCLGCPDGFDFIYLAPRQSVEALVAAGKSAYPFCYDLASLWRARFGKPMVFCRWVVRRDATPQIITKLLAWLGELDTKDDALVEQAAANEAWRLGLPRSTDHDSPPFVCEVPASRERARVTSSLTRLYAAELTHSTSRLSRLAARSRSIERLRS